MVMQESKKGLKNLFLNPFATERCDGCGHSYQAGLTACPRCKKENPNPGRAIPFDETKMMTPLIELLVFFFGWLGLQLIAEVLVQFFGRLLPNEDFLKYGLLLVNYGAYLLLTVGIVGMSWRYLPKFFKNMWRKETLFGLLALLAIYLFDMEWANFSSYFHVEENMNQETVNIIVKQSPILAIIFTGIFSIKSWLVKTGAIILR